MKTYQIRGRGEERKIREGGRTAGSFATDLAASEYGYNRFIDAPWFDARRKDTGAVIEVKSTRKQIGIDYPAKGRFRLFKDRHEKRLQYDRENSAYYVFVLFDLDSEGPKVARMVRKKPAKVGHIIGSLGGWGPSGHKGEGKQHKIPISALFD